LAQQTAERRAKAELQRKEKEEKDAADAAQRSASMLHEGFNDDKAIVSDSSDDDIQPEARENDQGEGRHSEVLQRMENRCLARPLRLGSGLGLGLGLGGE